jgi:Fe-S cluster assembly iron-binding protein IscA
VLCGAEGLHLSPDLGIVAGPEPQTERKSMLTLTQTAAEAVKEIVARVPLAEDGGVRIRDTGGSSGFELSVAPDPGPHDTVVIESGARVFLDETAAIALEDRVLDAELANDGSVRFALGNQG